MRSRISNLVLEKNTPMTRHSLSRKTAVSMDSPDEQRAIMGYLVNLVNAGFEKQHPNEIFAFCESSLGTRQAYQLLKPHFPGKLDASDSEDLSAWAARKISANNMVQCIREIFYPAIDNIISNLSNKHCRELYYRLEEVTEVFRLGKEEIAILKLFYLISTNAVAEKNLGSGPLDLRDYTIFRNIGHVALGLDRNQFLTTLGQTAMFDVGIMNRDLLGLSIDQKTAEYLSGVGVRKLKNMFFTREGAAHPDIKDFFLPPQELRVLKALLKGNEGCNILFYGEPGSGKTSLACSLAKHLGLDLLMVRVDETGDDHDFRFRAIHAALNAVKRKGSIILVDEADEILNAAAMPQVRNLSSKSWINNFLDNHDRKIIWITNRSWGIEPSTMRRFAFSLRFDKLTHKNRMSVLRYELEKNDLAGYYDEHEIKDLASRYDVDAGGIVNAVNVLKLQKRGSKGRVKETVEAVLKNHQEATIGKRHSVRPRDFLTYSLEGLNTSQDLERIITQLKNHSERKANLPNISVSILLYGQPGTGKSEFVHYLSHCLGRDIALKRVSDIESKYVGESEQNIARAFREAQADDSLLFFDEADSFFYPRKDALQSYEKKFTNELLAQLDDYQGVVIFATNDIEGLDHAAIRRFRFKIQFLPLKPEGILHFYRLLLSPLVTGGGNPGSNERLRLLSIQNLTPGDFAVVKDQYFFDQGAMVFHEDLISALEREVGHKKGMRVVPGFNSGMN